MFFRLRFCCSRAGEARLVIFDALLLELRIPRCHAEKTCWHVASSHAVMHGSVSSTLFFLLSCREHTFSNTRSRNCTLVFFLGGGVMFQQRGV